MHLSKITVRNFRQFDEGVSELRIDLQPGVTALVCSMAATARVPGSAARSTGACGANLGRRPPAPALDRAHWRKLPSRTKTERQPNREAYHNLPIRHQ